MHFSSEIDFTQLESNESSVQVYDAAQLLSESRSVSFEFFRKAVDDIKAIRRKYITVCACSFGKDSTVVLLANLTAHIELMNERVLNNTSPLVVSHIDTGVENHLMQMLCNMEIKRLKRYCKLANINLDFRFSIPPLAKQWAPLFISGMKIVSAARTNSDCSVVMKINNAERLERAIEKDYNGQVVTLLGSRLDESIARATKMRRAGTDKVRAQDLIASDKIDDRVFAPIINMSDTDVWNIIRGAGSSPIESMNFDILSWAPNHRLLNIIYADSKDGACAYSSKKIKGDKAQAGGCAGSPRTGCYTCAKSITDKSGEEQAKKPRHATISGNMLKVRNYLMWVAQDIQYRTFHGRAVDHSTGAIALQPNVLRPEIIDKLMWYLTQATFDDYERAQRFTKLVSQGRQMEDSGYADIMTDSSLDEEDRKALADVYLEQAQRHLIKPMTFEIALYLSAIHSRDGIRLPPHRALWIWNEVANGARIPYPEVNLADVVISDIPDAIMALPSKRVPYPSMHEFDFLSVSDADGCEVDLKQINSTMSVKDAKYFLQGEEALTVGEKKDNETICLQGIRELKWASKVRYTALSKVRPRKFSKRVVKKFSRKNGKYRVTQRGRTSLDSPSFSSRTATPHLEIKMTQNIPLYVYDSGYSESLNLDPESDVITGFDVNTEAMYDWLQYGGFESAIQAHNDAIEMRKRHDHTIYFYGGMGAFQHYNRYGVFKLNESALVNTKRILQRTAYFSRLGLFAIDEDAIVDISKRNGNELSIGLEEYRDTQTRNIKIDITSILSMEKYRSYKAGLLLSVRERRNVKRKKLKALISRFNDSPTEAALGQIKFMAERVEDVYADAVDRAIVAKSLIDAGTVRFDGRDYRQIYKINTGVLRYIRAQFEDEAVTRKLFDPVFYKAISTKGDMFKLAVESAAVLEQLDKVEERAFKAAQETLRTGETRTVEHILLGQKNVTTLSKLAIHDRKSIVNKRFKLNDTLNINGLSF